MGYLDDLLTKYSLGPADEDRLRAKRDEIERYLRSSYGGAVKSYYYSGSFGKRTVISLKYDLDIAVYFHRESFDRLSDMYKSLHSTLARAYTVRPQTVSIGIVEGAARIDVVPVRDLPEKYQHGNLYNSEAGTSLQTSVMVHREIISESRARDLIRLAKIARYRHELPIKSFVLELLVIRADGTNASTNLEERFQYFWDWCAKNIETVRLVDPANVNNVVSDLMSAKDRRALRDFAIAARDAKSWGSIVY